MANVIKCPACGENNLSDQEFCQYCQARLQPLTGNLKGADAPLTPGQFPTKKNTGELEPILPQWLRDARSSARQTSQEAAAQADQQPQESRPASSGGDLLAGLHAQRQAQDNDEEDTPDWLTNITGETPKTKKSQTESSDVRWVELGDANDFAQSEPAPDDDTPAWLKGISPSTPQPDEKDELTDWFRDANDSQKSQQPSQPIAFDSPPSAPSDTGTQDWLHSMVADDGVFNDSENVVDEPFISSDTPDWLRAMDAQNATPPSSNAGAPPVSSDTPDWLRAMAAPEKTQSADSAGFSETGLGESGAAFSSAGDTPDWLKGFDSGTSSSDQDWLKDLPPAESEKPAQDSAPAWLSAAPSFAPEQEETPAAHKKDADADIPNWLKPAAPASDPAPEKDDDALDIPGWLKAAAPQSSIYDEPAVEQEVPTPASSSDSSDWLNAFKSVDLPDDQAVPAFSMETPFDSAPPVFADDAQPTANEDALFTDMPAWLSVVDESVSPESVPTPITNADAIAPGDLPSWVQAMRPVDAGIPQPSSTSLSSDKKLESSGALAGLQGVLPAVKGFSPTSKPKAYSIKMQASEEQQAHAALLEQILAAETAPVPIGSFSTLGTSRGLRWLLVFLFFAALTAVLFMQTQVFSMPVGLPVEVDGALKVAQSIPQGAPVLAVFDYEPARVGEMEVAAAPLFDQMILLHHPRLTFISTNETGAILAERLISGPLAGHNYQSGVQYLNLGYLP
ncbi:MAG: zinc ribbon domain-containing protein, partial [Anaerolineales bacterium]|nr:zinc ribbon domain-containing protein [Anaerolineales bacterium]